MDVNDGVLALMRGAYCRHRPLMSINLSGEPPSWMAWWWTEFNVQLLGLCPGVNVFWRRRNFAGRHQKGNRAGHCAVRPLGSSGNLIRARGESLRGAGQAVDDRRALRHATTMWSSPEPPYNSLAVFEAWLPISR